MPNEPAERINIMLTPEILEYLDEETRRIRRRTRRRVSRSELVRAIFKAIASQQLTFEQCGTEADITTAFAGFLDRGKAAQKQRSTHAHRVQSGR